MAMRGVAALLSAIVIGFAPMHSASAAYVTTAPGANIWAVGDIASCQRYADTRVANRILQHRGTVLTLGDHAYPSGSPDDFNNCFDPVWHDLMLRTQPAPGNHEYETTDAIGYFGYFRERARSGYYAINRGEWRVYSLNSSIIDQAQLDWLAADLAAHPTTCALAYWHEPLFTSRPLGPSPAVKPFWDLLYAAGVDVVLNGHAHSYERFAPQTPEGISADDGIREFVVGTGGAMPGSLGTPAANSEIGHVGSFGALHMRLEPASYTWQFVRAAGDAFSDSGTGVCH
jgi:hypothetical protein